MHVIPTDRLDLTLIELTRNDTQSYFDLVDRNREHLTQYGDYEELAVATLDSVAAQLSDPADRNTKFGIWLGDILIGRANLSPRQPGHFVIGYWLGRAYTGNGYATIACRTLMEYGRDQLGATHIFAGVTKGNVASEALLGRLGFEQVADKGAYRLYQLECFGNAEGVR